jgi:hypothetical protein
MIEMHMVADRALRSFVENNPDLVSMRISIRHPELRVVKYKNKVFYKNLWTPELQELRGLVIDQNWRVVVRPFTKIFNRFENGADFPLDTPVAAVRKVNGFMGAITVDDEYGTIVSTTGSLDSPFVAMAEKYLLPLKDRGLINGVTYLFEIVDPEDPHIIEELPGAYLIGARTVCSQIALLECDLDEIAKGMDVYRPHWQSCSFGEIVEQVKTVKHEGFVVYNKLNGKALKLKSPYYLTKKFFSRVNGDKLTENWLAANRDGFDEEYYPLIDYIKAHRDAFTALDQAGRKIFIEDFLCHL